MTKPNFNVLLVDDEQDLCFLLSRNIESLEVHNTPLFVDYCHTVADAKALLQKRQFDIVITDFNLKNETGLELVSHVVTKYPSIPIVVLSAYSKQEIPHIALQVGAFDFIHKPVKKEALQELLNNALKPHADTSTQSTVLERLIGTSEKMLQFKSYVLRISKTQAPIFIRGESGTGKEVVSRIIHDLSNRSDGAFVAINCGAIPEQLLESELFGHKKGSFTGATSDKDGLIKKADKGTLFLDEIAELPLTMQVKLLRAIQEKKIRPIGADTEISVDFRLISATHQNIESMIDQNKFRKDLFYRLCVMDVNIPPLRERGLDIILLAEFFTKSICSDWGVPNKKLSKPFQQWLLNQLFDGNVRELINIIQRAITLSDGDEILLENLHLDLNNKQATPNTLNFTLGLANSEASDKTFSISMTSDSISQSDLLHSAQQLVAKSEPELKPQGDNEVDSLDLSDVYIPDDLEQYLLDVEKKILQKLINDKGFDHYQMADALNLTMRQLRYKLKKHDLT